MKRITYDQAWDIMIRNVAYVAAFIFVTGFVWWACYFHLGEVLVLITSLVFGFGISYGTPLLIQKGRNAIVWVNEKYKGTANE